ncbi:hypothetical protein B0H11DRAFT_2012277, partial [Mycena galericulata]
MRALLWTCLLTVAVECTASGTFRRRFESGHEFAATAGRARRDRPAGVDDCHSFFAAHLRLLQRHGICCLRCILQSNVFPLTIEQDRRESEAAESIESHWPCVSGLWIGFLA